MANTKSNRSYRFGIPLVIFGALAGATVGILMGITVLYVVALVGLVAALLAAAWSSYKVKRFFRSRRSGAGDAG